jgi:PIN domain nuclease of toxin-antitoxin system
VRVLLDTHALIWALVEPERLSVAARELVEDKSHELVVSSASAWEIGTKFRLGRLPGLAHVVESYDEKVAHLGATTLSITPKHAMYAGRLDWEHGDPFDRILAAQSAIEAIPLVTRDRSLQSLSSIQTIW